MYVPAVSTTTPLAGSASYTKTFLTTPYNFLVLAIQPTGDAGTYTIEAISPTGDATVLKTATVADGDIAFPDVRLTSNTTRITYTNGSTDLTAFSLFVSLHSRSS